MARPSGTKNVMRSPKEKEEILKEKQLSGTGYYRLSKKYGISKSTLRKWANDYKENGISGLNSNTGKYGMGKGKFKRTEIEQLREELLKKEIEIMRLKKGYTVRGVGAKKEYVSTSDMNMK